MSKNVMVWKHFLDIRELELGPRVSGRYCVAFRGEKKIALKKVCGRTTDDGRASEVV